MSITTAHTDYVKHIATWNKLDDVCGGQEVIKLAGEKYLPKPSLFKSKNDPDGKNRYSEYLMRAIFPGVTGRTLASHIGLAFGKSPIFNKLTIWNILSVMRMVRDVLFISVRNVRLD